MPSFILIDVSSERKGERQRETDGKKERDTLARIRTPGHGKRFAASLEEFDDLTCICSLYSEQDGEKEINLEFIGRERRGRK